MSIPKFINVILLITFLLLGSPANAFSPVENREQLLNLLESDGITPGKIVWQRHQLKIQDKYGQSPGLTKLIFLDADLRPEYKGLSAKLQIVIFCRNEKNEEIGLVLSKSTIYFPGESGTALGKLYIEDPKRKTSKWSKKVLSSIASRSISIGMTAEQVRTSWGPPTEVNSSVGPWGRSEQWIYGDFPDATYIYIRNGKLESWQD